MEDRTCVWPGCGKSRGELAICDTHADIVSIHVAKTKGDITTRWTGPTRDPNPDGLVYYLLIDGLVKIGFTTRLEERLSAYPPHAKLLATEPGKKALEAQRHKQLRHSLSRGREWFIVSDEVNAHIATVVAEHGEGRLIRPRTQRNHVRLPKWPVTVRRITP